MHSTMSHRTSCLQGCKQEEIGVVRERNVLRLSIVVFFEDTKLDNRRRINRPSVGRGLESLASLVH
jgi:hypothetical protein